MRLDKDYLSTKELEKMMGREEVHLDDAPLIDEIQGKSILIAGAGGSIGSEIARRILIFQPKQVLLLGHGEYAIYQIYHELLQLSDMRRVELIPIIADIRNEVQIEWILSEYRPDIIYHVAAHKHVPLMEANPVEAYDNNVNGTDRLVRAVSRLNFSKLVFVSTDKAVRPINVMGATKRLGELIVTQANHHSNAIFTVVRFGNVLDSRGSVIPAFRQMIAKGGPVKVSDFRMTRYFMSIKEAAQLVIHAGVIAQGGEIMVLDMGDPVKILDLARQMIALSGQDGIHVIESGIRLGDKLAEELFTESEIISHDKAKKLYIGRAPDISRAEIQKIMDELDKHFQYPQIFKQKLINSVNNKKISHP